MRDRILAVVFMVVIVLWEHDALNCIHLFYIKRCMVLSENIVEPQWGLLRLGHRFVPRKDRIRLAADKTPVNGCHIVLLEQRQNRLEVTTIAACHILGADHRAFVLTESVDTLTVIVRIALGVVGDDVGVGKLELIEFGTLHEPYAYSEWLAHLAFARPTEDVA